MRRRNSKQRRTFWDKVSDLLWKDRSDEPLVVRILIGQVRALFFAYRGFFAHQLPLRASALTYVTLLSLIPVLALAFAAAKGLGFAPDFQHIRNVKAGVSANAAKPATVTHDIATSMTSVSVTAAPMVADTPSSATSASVPAVTSPPAPNPLDLIALMPSHEFSTAPAATGILPDEQEWGELLWDGFVDSLTAEQVEIRSRIEDYIEKTNFGTLKALGIILLIITTITALGAMEETFNTIWHVHYSRRLLRKFTDYLSVIIVCPILVMAAIATTATLSSTSLARQFYSFEILNQMVALVIAYASFLSIWAALTFLYWFLPNTNVKLHYAAVGALVGGLTWEGAFWIYSKSMGSMNAIYATLAALPFFLTWLYCNWVVVLFGAEVAAAYQNREIYERDVMMGEISPAERLRLGLNIVLTICTRFWREQPAWTAEQLSRYLECSVGRSDEILETLSDAGILATSGAKPPRYQPGVPLAKITPARVIEALQEAAGDDLCGNATPEALSARSLMVQWREGLWRELGHVGFDVLVDDIQHGRRPLAPEPVRESPRPVKATVRP